jgi:hypothetical protein
MAFWTSASACLSKMLGIGRKVWGVSSEEHKYARLRRDLGFQAVEPATEIGLSQPAHGIGGFGRGDLSRRFFYIILVLKIFILV